jgi:hypothetical protein
VLWKDLGRVLIAGALTTACAAVDDEVFGTSGSELSENIEPATTGTPCDKLRSKAQTAAIKVKKESTVSRGSSAEFDVPLGRDGAGSITIAGNQTIGAPKTPDVEVVFKGKSYRATTSGWSMLFSGDRDDSISVKVKNGLPNSIRVSVQALVGRCSGDEEDDYKAAKQKWCGKDALEQPNTAKASATEACFTAE